METDEIGELCLTLWPQDNNQEITNIERAGAIARLCKLARLGAELELKRKQCRCNQGKWFVGLKKCWLCGDRKED